MTAGKNISGSAARGSMDTPNEKPDVPPTAEEILAQKSKSKLVRIASVIVYVAAVGGNGFLLSIFFLFIWDPQINVTRPPNMAPDNGLFGRLTADPLVAHSEIIVAQALKNPKLPTVPYRRIMSNEFTNNYIKNFHENIVPGSNSDIPEPSHVLPSSEQEEYENNESTVKPVSSSPHYTMESKNKVSNIGSKEGDASSSTSDEGPMAKPKKADAAVASAVHQRPTASQT